MRKRRIDDEGFALMLVIMILAIVFLLLMAASVQTLTTTRILALRLAYQGQALNASHAGLVEGLDYFRRQTAPVNNFNPQRNLAAVPPIDETDLVTVPPTIQRDFLINSVGKVWGHYELTQGDPATNKYHNRYGGPTCATHVAGCLCDLPGGVTDLTQNRRSIGAGTGSIWQVDSIGTVYVRNDPAVAFNVAPNLVISQKTVRTEIQRVALNLPNDAGLILTSGARAFIGTAANTRARVIGGPSDEGVVTKNGAPVVAAGATLSGNPASAVLATMDFTINTIFGVPQSDLAAIADHSVTAVADLPDELPMRLVVVNVGAGTATFNAAHPLVGSGILLVLGNLTIDGGPSSFSGIIYVTGNYLQVGPSTVNGTVIVTGATSNATVRGSTEFAEIYFDRFMKKQVANQLGQFRFARPAFLPCPTGDPNCNSKFAEN